MSVRWCESDAERLLLVEGVNDCHAIYHLAFCKELGDGFGIRECKNDEGALRTLGAMVVGSSPKRAIGLVLDCDSLAEDDAQSTSKLDRRWQQICTKLPTDRYTIPAVPSPTGTILEPIGLGPRIGVWIMPDNRSDGMIEDFLAAIANREACDFAKSCVAAAEKAGFTTYKSVHRSKAIIHTYLAWQDEPGAQLSVAIKQKYLDPNHPEAIRFSTWM